MKKSANNFAFIDGNNLHLTMANLGWSLDYQRFRVYLREHYSVAKAYYFIGYIPKNKPIYSSLESAGYELKYKEIMSLPDGTVKGNCDAELILQAMIDIDNYDKVVLVSSDGDFSCLVKYLVENDKLECLLAPCQEGCSILLMRAAGKKIAFVDRLQNKLEYKKGAYK